MQRLGVGGASRNVYGRDHLRFTAAMSELEGGRNESTKTVTRDRFRRLVAVVQVILRVFALTQAKSTSSSQNEAAIETSPQVSPCFRTATQKPLPISKRPMSLLELTQPRAKQKIDERIQQRLLPQGSDSTPKEDPFWTQHSSLSESARNILTNSPWTRTAEQINLVCQELQFCDAFKDYATHIQKSLCRIGWYQRYGPGRVILKEGHPPSCCFYILAGKVTVMKGKESTDTLTSGDSFGELAIVHNSKQMASYISASTTELFSFSKSDYLDLSLRQAKQSYQRAKHFAFCKTVSVLKHWPLDLLQSQPHACQVGYFKPNAIVVKDSLKSDWVYVVMAGSCRVVKRFIDSNERLRQERRRRTIPGVLQPSKLTLASESASTTSHTNRVTGRRSMPALFEDHDNTLGEKRSHLRVPPSHTVATPQGLSDKTKKQFLVQLQLLQPKDVFGLSPLVYRHEPSVTLVSNGAELVMISKTFLEEHFTETMRSRLKRQVVQFPSQEAMLKRVREHYTWSIYKQSMVKNVRRKV